jgi:hypothetical protein
MTRNLNEIVNCTFLNSASVIGVHSFFSLRVGLQFHQRNQHRRRHYHMFIRYCTVYFLCETRTTELYCYFSISLHMVPEFVDSEVFVPQSIYIYRVPQCTVCPLVGIGSPNPSLASECAPPPLYQKWGGRHSPAGEGLGESQFRRLEKKA